MALKRPPTHAADAEPRFIWGEDTAWDMAKIDAERDGLEDKSTHPVDRYLAGKTRFDLDAPMTIGEKTVRVTDYLNGTPPTVFHLRRVGVMAITRAQRGLSEEALATVSGLARDGTVKIVDGLTDGQAWKTRGVGSLTDDDLQDVYDISPLLVQSLGFAVYHASKSLSESEGKP